MQPSSRASCRNRSDAAFATLTAGCVIGVPRDDRAIKPIANLARLQRWFAPRRSRQLRQRAVDTLVKIGTPSAKASLDGLIKTGDRQLRKMATVARNPELQR